MARGFAQREKFRVFPLTPFQIFLSLWYNILYMAFKILAAPNPVLVNQSQPVLKIDRKILRIIQEMEETLVAQKNPKGVGLAAPQVGYPLRIFVAKPSPKSDFRVFINPEITWKSNEITEQVPERPNPLEGCLSIPGIWGKVKRHQSLKLRYFTPDGKTHRQKFEGFLATIIQHEMDHLSGCLFPQRVLEQKGKLYKSEKNKEGKSELVEIELNL